MYIDLIKTLIDRITLASDSYLIQGTVPGSIPGLVHKSDNFSQLKLSNQLYSTLHLLLCLIKNKKIKQNIDTYFTRSFAKTFVETLLDLIKSFVISLKKDKKRYSQNKQNNTKEKKKDGTNKKEEDLRLFWPTWLSPFCVLLYELIIAPIGLSEMQTLLSEVESVKNKKINQNGDGRQNNNIDSGNNGDYLENNRNKGKHKIDDSDEEKTENCIEEEKEDETELQLDSEINGGEGRQKDERGKGGNDSEENSGTASKNSEKCSGKDSSVESLSESELALELGTLLSVEVNRSSLLTELSWESIYESVFSILKSASLFNTLSDSNDENVFARRKESTFYNDENENENQNQSSDQKKYLKEEKSTKLKSKLKSPSKELPEIRYLDPSSNQGVLLLVHTLLSKRKLSTRFVASGGKCQYNLCLFYISMSNIFVLIVLNIKKNLINFSISTSLL